MIWWWLLNALIALAAILETAWLWRYARYSPWRETPVGWVWLLKGVALAFVFWFLLANQFWHVPIVAWLAIAGLLDVGIGAWLHTTVRVQRGRLRHR